MRSRRGCVAGIALALASVAGVGAAEESTSLARLSWLEGTWTGTTNRVDMEETWSSPRGGALIGMHKDTRDGRLLGYESFRIVPADSGRVVYLTSPNGAPPTAFHSTALGDSTVVFENKAHDFPQRILYRLDAAGALHARIEGVDRGKDRSVDWVWTRQPCR